MFKQLTALFLLFSFGATVFNQAVIVVHYYSNTSFYAKNCENKNSPMMHCNGKCQMTKKFQAEEKKDQQNPERRIENKNEVPSSKSFFASVENRSAELQKFIRPINSTLLPVGNIVSLFHPPA